MSDSERNDSPNGFAIVLACFGIYYVISTIIEGIDILINQFLR